MNNRITFLNRPIRISDIKDERALQIANNVNSEKDWRKDSISHAGIGDEFLTGSELGEFRERLINEFMNDYLIDKEINASVKADTIMNDARYNGTKGFLNAFNDVINFIRNKIGF